MQAALAKSASADNAELLRLSERMSRGVDRHCDPRGLRHFYTQTGVRYFDGHGDSELYVDDLISVTAMDFDLDRSGTYETSVTTFDLWPSNRSPKIRIDLPPYGGYTLFPCGKKTVRINGVWGYSADVESVGTLGAAISSTTTLSVTMTAGHSVSAGDTLVIGSEQLYVSAVDANTLTVVRGINGTTAATHSNGAAVSRRDYPPDIVQAVVMQVSRFWNEQKTGYSGGAGNPELGGFGFSSLYPAIRDLLSPYVVPVVV